MLILLAEAVVRGGALVHRLIQTAAPAALLGLAAVPFLTMHVAANAVSAGAPGWPDVLVLVLT